MGLPNWFSGTFGIARYLVWLMVMGTDVVAQVPSNTLAQRIEMDSTTRLEFQLGVVGYVKNNEYFNPFVEGYTLWGMQLAPCLAYRISPKVVLLGGIFWRNDFGETNKAIPEPLITIKVTYRNWNYLFGTLEGSLNHQLVEPLYNFERYLRVPIENGLQINHLDQNHFFDFWISYPRNTLPGYDRQENFWGGISSRIKIAGTREASLELLTQATAFHAGGQGISSPLPVRTALNAAIGMRAGYRFEGTRSSLIQLEHFWVGYLENGRDKRDGMAWYLNASLSLPMLSAMVSYWQGRGYRSEYGGDLYGSNSRSVVTPTFFEKDRKWIMLRLLKTFRVGGGLSLSARFEPTFDLIRKKLEHSEGIYLKYHLHEKIQKKSN